MAWWEDQGQLGMFQGQKFNATAFIFQVKNRFPSVYRDRQEHNVKSEAEIKHTGKIEHVTSKDVAQAPTADAALRAFEAMRKNLATQAPIGNA